jgi:hypothetical protein
MMTEAKMELAAAILATAAEGHSTSTEREKSPIDWFAAAKLATRDEDLGYLVAILCRHSHESACSWARLIIAKGSP